MNRTTSAFDIFSEEGLRGLSTTKIQQEFYDDSFTGPGSFGVRVSKNCKKSFFLIYSINGKRKRITLGRYPLITLLEAKDLALAQLKLLNEGRDPAAEDARHKVSETFGELSTKFITRYVDEKCKPSTAKEYRRIIETELLPIWEDRKVSSIRKADVITLLDEISFTRKAPVMAERIRAFLSKIFNFAMGQGIITDNPASSIVRPTLKEISWRVLLDEEIKLLWHALREEDVRIAGIFKMILLTGQTPSSVMAMRWSDVQFDNWVVTRRSKSGVIKNHIFLSPQVLSVLREIRDSSIDSEYVFPSGKNSHIRHIRKAALRISNRMQITTAINPLALRRTVEVGLRQLQVRPDVIERILGRYTFVSRLSKRYGEYENSSEMRQALLNWGRKIASLVGVTPEKGEDDKVIRLFR